MEGFHPVAHIRMTSYHPCANRMVERFHMVDRHDSLGIAGHTYYPQGRPEVYSCRTGQWHQSTFPIYCEVNTVSYVHWLKGTMRALRCTPTRHPSQPRRRTDNSPSSASHVFVCHDAVKKRLQQPYDGPYLVLNWSDRFYTLDLNGRTDTISIDRLKQLK